MGRHRDRYIVGQRVVGKRSGVVKAWGIIGLVVEVQSKAINKTFAGFI